MPVVTKVMRDGSRSTNSGGCFGFMGRHSGVGQGIVEFIYHLNRQWTGSFNDNGANYNSRNTQQYNYNPLNYWQWLTNSSAWSKYVNSQDESLVSIKTDIPGHAVIGTASMYRLACKQDNLFIPLWNKMVELGSNPAIALLLAYSGSKSVSNLKNHDGSDYTGILHQLVSPGYGDDTPMQLTNIDINDIYGIINGNFHYSEDDSDPSLYVDTGRYQQQILNSFSTGRFNFIHYLTHRLSPYPITVGEHTGSSGGMGRSTQTTLQSNVLVPQEPLALIGLALQMTAEFKQTGRIGGLYGGSING